MKDATELQAGLYVVATPLGNLGDITARARSVLASVDTIACEDTRVTRELLHLLDIATPRLTSVREHNERQAAEQIVGRIASGAAVAYASDAGTPAISDPGARLVAAVRAAGFPIIPVPGVSAVTAALSVAGLESTAFTFAGFAPTGKTDLVAFFETAASRVETTVFFESPHRVEKTLMAAAAALPADRRVVVARELTKKFETVTALSAGALPAWLSATADRLRGEFVIVVAGAPAAPAAQGALIDARALLKALLAELPPAKAAKVAAKVTGGDRDTLYTLAESLKTAVR
ncbi:MAG: 16S rRNA (cytidine(1402)-2'-O)-methyltransferase [Burkholderiales bacterium]|nr:16S rRNA (cytidine(1402)-2'-O)-methyltransferase [Burkholderiales bacterium]